MDMHTDHCKVTAIIRCEVQETAEHRLQKLKAHTGIDGVECCRAS